MANYSTLTSRFAGRARSLIDSGDRASLLYAALEIRLGVEARLQSYVQASHEVSAALKKGWQIPKLFSGLEKTFSNSSQVVEFTMSSPSSPPITLHFVPVNAQLKRDAEQFGNALHVTAKSHSEDDWWTALRMVAERAVVDLEICSRATLLGVPLMNDSGQVHLAREFHESDERIGAIQALAKTGAPHRMKVDHIPSVSYYAAQRERLRPNAQSPGSEARPRPR